ncbi:MAG TPA: DUF3299 domain-containing protein [Burkholderiales bacterium]|nr:DUF3299 domain-containing protein [Burkholderiales bacterium]
MCRRIAFIAATAALFASSAPADERAAAVSWEALAKVSLVKQGDRYVPSFPKELAALDKTQVKLQGFMMPLEPAAKQKRFLLSALPSDCGFCMASGPDQLVEVHAKQGFTWVLDPITVSGRFVLVRDDAGGLLYRLTDAVAVPK